MLLSVFFEEFLPSYVVMVEAVSHTIGHAVLWTPQLLTLTISKISNITKVDLVPMENFHMVPGREFLLEVDTYKDYIKLN